MILNEGDMFFMSVGSRLYYGQFIRQTEVGALCNILNGCFRVIVDKNGRAKMPHTGEVANVEMIRRPVTFPFHALDFQAALSWYVVKGRKTEVAV